MAKKWQRMASLARKRLTPMPVADKGQFIVYSTDGRRFEVPLAYLSTAVFHELLSMSGEEFGFSGDDGKLTLPCDAAMVEYAICLLTRDAAEEVVKAFLSFMAWPCHHNVSGMAPAMGFTSQSAVCV